MTVEHYILEDDGSIKTASLMEWADWMENNREKRMIARDTVGDFYVSTVFLGLDHNFAETGTPVLFETMTFESAETVRHILGKERKFHKEAGEAGLRTEIPEWGRWHTQEEALEEHKKIVEAVRTAQEKKPEVTEEEDV